MKKHIAFFLAFIILSSCKTYNDDDLNNFDQQIQEYIKEQNLEFNKSESGMYYSIIDLGDGNETIRLTDQVTFIYKGSFLSGEVFQVIKEQDALTFQVRELIAGWQEALSYLTSGGKIHLIIPPHLGYGSKKTGLIEPHSILVYELEVLNVL
jgi:FKBP-type peptidyl-prolyl cis-trans isomerase